MTPASDQTASILSSEERPPRLPVHVGATIWVGIGLAFFASTTAQLSLLNQQQPAWQTLWDASSIFLFYGAATPVCLWVYRALRPASGGVLAKAIPALVAWLVFHALVQFAFTVVEYWFIAPLRGGEEFSYLALVRYHAVRRAPVAMLIFLGSIFFVENRRATWALAREEQRRLRITAELTAARLAALSGQLQPHFLFNTLNAVASMVHRDATAAERVIERLSDLLRASLAEGRETTIPLRREFDLIDDYLAIHAVRFPDRFSYALELPDDLTNFPIPPLLLQPLVENAIRHGLDHKLARGRLTVRAALLPGNMLQLSVEDDGVGVTLPLGRVGIGLENVRSRLAAIHGQLARLDLTRLPEGGTRATVILPRQLTSPMVSES